jgi:MarR family transcriptional regulator, organic hydroperoxide resistance regulator
VDKRNQEIGQIINSIGLIKGISQRHSRKLFAKYKITGQQLWSLRIINYSQSISLGELSEKMYLHISTCSGIVDRLEKRGYLVRKRSHTDRRVVYLLVTPKGEDIIKNAPIAGVGVFIHELGKQPPKEIHQIYKAMKLLLKVMHINIDDLDNVLVK